MSADQLKFYVIPAVLYAVVASPAAYKATSGVLGSWVASPAGCANIGGLILHAIVFILLATLAMNLFPKKASYGRSMYEHSDY
jgi:hypothetical protein